MSSSSSSSSSSPAFSLDHHLPSAEHLCYVHCNFCDTVLAVSVPSSSLFNTVTVRCGHCSNLLSVNMRGLILPTPANQFQLGHNFFTPQNFMMEEMRNTPPGVMINQPCIIGGELQGGNEQSPKPPMAVNRPPEKRQRVPSAYNCFIKEEIQRIKARNPDISHREAFSAAAKNWAHIPHIHCGLMADQPATKKTAMRQQEGEEVLRKDGLFAAANVGVSPY